LWLENNAAKSDVMVLPSGLQYSQLQIGSPSAPQVSSENTLCEIEYRVSRIDGVEIMSSNPAEPLLCRPGSLLAGWSEALSMMREGDKWRLHIPAALGYGAQGAAGGLIRPHDTLICDLHLLRVRVPKKLY